MISIRKGLDTREKLRILSHDSQYDLACACGMNDEDRRRRSKDDTWIYPVALPERRTTTFLFKTLISNVCVNDCKYCPLRMNRDPQRCTLTPEEVVKTFWEYYRAGKVMGLFVSSGVIGTPDQTMERLNAIAAILRKQHFKGYMHLKIIPGASDAAIEQAVSLANAVSINIETAGEKHFNALSTTKNYLEDIIRPMKLIHSLTQPGAPYRKVRQTTQFVVGASDETDQEIVNYSWGLYRRLGLQRIYFSAYQRGLGERELPGEHDVRSNQDMLVREHRLYQVDWLMRKYGFALEDVMFDDRGNLSLTTDPKELWAQRHPEFFPLNINTAAKEALLRVPGLGPTTVNAIVAQRKQGQRIRSLHDLGRVGKRLQKAAGYVVFT
ncbi:helix-hairpin-helix motif protein [Candidatus Moduliflexus flocculans]|uniref:Helix-hairpin-helix motif protein n=1 Tax=Candidatus Moduliflexus flocculans TaxID=1499966 RepID=A0A081BMN1_9BACT|nr:helix-hairpin-helix motif protein [Candidatus Moduliflexus flocculans]